MKFCNQCGITLSIIDPSDAVLCPVCLQKKPKKEGAQPADGQRNSDLFSAILSCHDGKIQLQSKEGWLLWSGDEKNNHSLQTIVNRAERILAIRKRNAK